MASVDSSINPVDTINKCLTQKVTYEDRNQLIKVINNNLLEKVNVETFLDSVTNQKDIKIIDRLKERFDLETKRIIYHSKDYKFSLSIKETDSTSNSIFYDDNFKIDFSKHQVTTVDNEEYKTETFGYNFKNRLYEPTIIEVSGKKFLYADVTFECNGKGCGCNINFIYDIKAQKGFFVDNFRFPYDKFFISDFNNDSIIDLLVIGRNRSYKSQVKGLPLYRYAYQATWLEYNDKNFTIKKGRNTEEPYSFEFISYTTNGEYPSTKFSLIENK